MAMAAQAIPHPYPFVSYQPPNAYNFRVSVPSIYFCVDRSGCCDDD